MNTFTKKDGSGYRYKKVAINSFRKAHPDSTTYHAILKDDAWIISYEEDTAINYESGDVIEQLKEQNAKLTEKLMKAEQDLIDMLHEQALELNRRYSYSYVNENVNRAIDMLKGIETTDKGHDFDTVVVACNLVADAAYHMRGMDKPKDADTEIKRFIVSIIQEGYYGHDDAFQYGAVDTMIDDILNIDSIAIVREYVDSVLDGKVEATVTVKNKIQESGDLFA
jgi:hypothetical protein